MIWGHLTFAGPGYLVFIDHELLCLSNYLESNARPLDKTGSCIRSVIQKTSVDLQQKGWRREKPLCCKSPVKENTSAIRNRMKMFISECLQMTMNWSNVVMKSGPKLLHTDRLTTLSRKPLLRLIRLKAALQAIKSWRASFSLHEYNKFML